MTGNTSAVRRLSTQFSLKLRLLGLALTIHLNEMFNPFTVFDRVFYMVTLTFESVDETL